MAKKKFAPFLQADDYFAVVPNDLSLNFEQDSVNNPQGYPLACLYIGVAGNVKVASPTKQIDGVTDNTQTFVGVAAGTTLPVLCKRVIATGTTATNILGLVGIGMHG